ncbi:MAG TPA: hypothetical protein VK602_09570 [Phyllobacterium sp.]|nr:hypothetical protein [Phyllobacterium sp.]
MNGMPFKTRILTLVVILSNVLGNFALSLGMKAHAVAVVSSGMMPYVRAFFSPMVLLGVSLLILWMLSRMALMSWADLSFVLPITSIGYVMSALMGKFFLDEHISSQRWAGTLLIVAGIALVSFTPSRTPKQHL